MHPAHKNLCSVPDEELVHRFAIFSKLPSLELLPFGGEGDQAAIDQTFVPGIHCTEIQTVGNHDLIEGNGGTQIDLDVRVEVVRVGGQALSAGSRHTGIWVAGIGIGRLYGPTLDGVQIVF